MPGMCGNQSMGPSSTQPVGGGMCGPYQDPLKPTSAKLETGYSIPGQYESVPVNRTAPKMNGVWGSPR